MNIMPDTMPAKTDEADAELWRLSRDGDREAFGRIVERYQSLICSLAYSRCGSLGTAWHNSDQASRQVKGVTETAF